MISIEVRRLLLRYRVASVLTLVLGIALSTLVFFTVESRDRTNLRHAFDDAASNVQSAIVLGLQRSLDEVNSVGALFDSSNITNHEQFDVFAKELLATSQGIQALEWIPLVPSAMRDNYEKAAQEAFPGFRFTERKAQGQMIREGARDEYFPVYFVEPEAANRSAIGFDLGSDAVRLETLKKARDTGQIVATGRVTLVQETATQNGFLLFRPVYRSGLPHEATEQRHDNLLGFALGVFRISDVIEAAAGHLQPAGISAAIYDDSAPASERFLAAWPAATRDQTSLNGQTQAKPELRRIESLDIGGRHWKVVLTPTTQFYRSGPSRSSWVALLVGLMISVLLVAYIEAARQHMGKELETRDARLAAEEKLTEILDSIDSILMSVVPQTGDLLYANRAAERIFNRALAEFSDNKRLWLEVIHPDDQRRIYQRLSLPPEQDSWSDEFRITRPSGDERWLDAKAKAVHDLAGNVARIDIVASDITERKRDEVQRERLASLVEASPDFIGFADPKTTQIQYINKYGRRMCGIGENEDVGKLKISDVHPVWMNKLLAEVVVPAAVRDGLWEGEGAFLHRNGREIPVSMALLARKAANGEVDILYTVSRDITERKRTEERLQKLSHAVEQSPAATAITDTHGHFEYVNPKFLEVTGYTQEELIGKTPAVIKSGLTLPEVYEDLWRTILSGTEWRGELQNRRKNGELYWEYEIISPLKNERGEIVNYIAVKEDITERKQAVEELHESEARFRSLTEMSSDFYWESDAEHRLTMRASSDQKLPTVSVFRQGAQIGKRRWEIPYLSPDEPGWQAHRVVLDAHRPFRNFELSRVGSDGTEQHIAISGDPMFDASGAFKGYRGVGTDITERIRRIDDLQRLRAAMDVTNDSIYLTDPATMRFVEINDAACRRLG